jgi:branched-chain amino acid transport system permease protein
MDEHVLAVVANVGLFSFLALSAYVLLIGGEMSFGQQAFFGIGAYAAGMATAMAAWPLAVALLGAIALGALAASAVGLITLRLRGLYFSMATLAAAEAIRIFFELFRWRMPTAEGEIIGPNGSDGFGGIRYQFEHGLSTGEFVTLIYGLLLVVLLGLLLTERARVGVALRMAGADPELASVFGIDVRRVKLAATAVAGGIAALGGGLFAHYSTYIEPRNFDVMLGVHSMAYALIGGLGTPIGPLLGVGADIVLLESSRVFHGYRMIAFGGLVALFLIVRPRGLLDERTVHRIRTALRRMVGRTSGSRRQVRKHALLAALVVLCTALAPSASVLACAVHAAAPSLEADIQCQPAGMDLAYDCTIRLRDARSGAPVSGAQFAVGADMPSMPMAHNVKPATAVPTRVPGEYRARLTLEMYGMWTVKLRIAAPVRDQITKTIEFQKSP